jgi:acyl carrier protein
LNESSRVALVVTEEWRGALAVTTSAPDDDFFMLGGNSMMAVGLVERVERRLNIEFPLEALFVEGTLGRLIEACGVAPASRAAPMSPQP